MQSGLGFKVSLRGVGVEVQAFRREVHAIRRVISLRALHHEPEQCSFGLRICVAPASRKKPCRVCGALAQAQWV